MSRSTAAVLITVFVLALAGAALFVWERGCRSRPEPAEPRAERLLIGLNPQNVRRVRIRWADNTVELVKRHGVWEPASGTPGSSIRVDVLLSRVATLRVTLAPQNKGRRLKLGRAVAELKVWRGRARPILLRLYRRKSGTLITSSDRPGVYRSDGSVLAAFERELKAPQLPPVWPLKLSKLASVELKGSREVTLRRRTGRWFVEDSAALAPADPVAVGRLLRSLQGLAVTHRIAQGAAALNKHGLDKPRLTIRVDDGSKRTLRLGGVCPRSKGAVLASLDTKQPAVLCVTRPEAGALEGPFVNRRLFSVAPDEIKAVNITRGGKTLALVNRPGSGGWKMISPSEGKVDQAAAAALVAQLARLTGAPSTQAAPPNKARQVGSVLLTPMTGSEERVELHGLRKAPTLWARRMGGKRWFPIGAGDRRLLDADPVVLRSRDICTEPQKVLLNVVKNQPGRVTELLQQARGTWQIVLLSGRKGYKKAKSIGARLEDYRPAVRPGAGANAATGWKKPILLVGNPDRAHLTTLKWALKAIRAEGYAASKARREHGLGGRGQRLTYDYVHSCKTVKGKRQCQPGRCALDFGAGLAGGKCFARRVGDPAVFVASAALCKAAQQPVANRRVVTGSMHQLASITLKHRGKTQRLLHVPRKGWKRPTSISVATWESATGVLLQLAPLTARAVVGYEGRMKAKPVLTVVMRFHALPDIRLDFYEDDDDPKFHLLVREGLPLRYRVASPLVKGLSKLAMGK